MNRKNLALPAVIGLVAPLIAACGGSDGGSDALPVRVGTTDQVAASAEAPAPLDPAYAYDVGSWNVLRQTMQTLLAQPRGGGDPQPEAAESCEFTDTGNERYSCTLRKGLKFADGDPITADDVKYSLERVLRIDSDSGVAGLLSTVDTVETRGEREVVFHLNSADATFPYKLSTPVASIVDPDEYPEGKLLEGFEAHGSGLYTFEAEVKDGALAKAVFTRNPNYRGSLETANERAELIAFDTAEKMADAITAGDIDVMSRTLTPKQVKELDGNRDDAVDLVKMSGLDIRYLAFDTGAPAVQNKAVRQAIAQIVNREELVAEVYDSQSEPLYSLVPATITGHSNSFFNRYGEPSVPKAAKILSEAGISTPVPLDLHFTLDHYGSATEQEFDVLAEQLNDSGLFKVSEPQGAPWKEFRPASLKGKYEVWGMGWFPDFPDADNYLAPFLDKKNILGTPYANAKVQQSLIPRSRREPDRTDAVTSLTEMQEIVAEDVPVLPLWQGKQYVAAREGVMGAAYALNSASELQLWELSRGAGSE
ncbi:ABC transporter substrate-binding protein [Streptomyces sp. MJP52]|uniref:ABC transporter substrate-binding protein n=1 Tax=Streptomyces sp. MJP52 TaxID=2940555 RepID=UPI002473CD5C|nr:ABC transporter substrate-binding protein [Streptomyces sp. MJP52]MDH6227733.1 peptide/nickel transport system substrate-binding protein [Streptomyces sp. MJP52]